MNNHNLTIATVNFMTPDYITILVKSLHKSNPWWDDEIIVYDNGPTKTTDPGHNDGFYAIHVPDSVYDDFKTMAKVNDPGWRNYASAKHAKTIQYLIDNTHTEYLLLLDTDVVFTDNFECIFNTFTKYEYVIGGFIREPPGYKKRLAPWCSFINLGLYYKYGLTYYDPNRMLYINGNRVDDTGSVIYEDCIKNKYPVLQFPVDNSFYMHFKGGSYTDKSKVNQWIEKFRPYWE